MYLTRIVELIYRNDLSRFEIRGPIATSIINNVIKIASQCNEQSQQAWHRITTKITRADSLPIDMVLSLSIKHPLSSSLNAGDFRAVKETIINGQIPHEDLFLTIPDHIAECPELWEKKVYKPHNKSNQDDSDNEMINNDRDQRSQLQNVQILLIQRPSSLIDGFGSGWDIVCPINMSVHLWDKLSKQKNVLPIPFTDRNRMLTEQSVLTFPNDFPRSKAFHRKTTESEPENVIDQYNRFKNDLNVASSFDTLVSVIINCPWGGTPEKEEKLYTVKTRHDKHYEPILISTVIDNDATMIGVVTTGIYSFIRGKGYAIGIVNTRLITDEDAVNIERQNGKLNQRLIWLKRAQHFLPMTFSIKE
jgi:hypothetical protein